MKKLFIILCLWSFVWNMNILAQYTEHTVDVVSQNGAEEDFEIGQTIFTKEYVKKLMITEVERYAQEDLDVDGFTLLGDPDYPFGRGIELTASPSLTEPINLTQYGLAFFKYACQGQSDGALKKVTLENYGNNGILNPSQSIWIAFDENSPYDSFEDLKLLSDSPDCLTNPDIDGDFFIALYQTDVDGTGERLVNFINFGNKYANPGSASVASSLLEATNNSTRIYSSVPVRVNPWPHKSDGTVRVSYIDGTSNWGWCTPTDCSSSVGDLSGNPYTEGVTEHNLESFETLIAPIYDSDNNIIVEILTKPGTFSSYENQNNTIISNHFGFNRALTDDQSVFYKAPSMPDWNSSPYNYIDWDAFPIDQNDGDNALQKAITVHWGVKKCLDFFQERHCIEYTNSDYGDYLVSEVIPFQGAALGKSSSVGMEFMGHPYSPSDVQISVFGHEIGHLINAIILIGCYENPNNPSQTLCYGPTDFNIGGDVLSYEESFADIWSASAVKNILNLDENDEYITGAILDNDFKYHIEVASPKYFQQLNIGNLYKRHRYLQHWYYLLSEGPEDVQPLSPDSYFGDLNMNICGIDEEKTSIIFKEHFANMKYDVYQDVVGNDGILELINDQGEPLDLTNLDENPSYIDDPDISDDDQVKTRTIHRIKNATVDAVSAIYDYLEDGDPTNDSKYSMFGNREDNEAFIIAQVKNAWGEVNVGEPDFNVTTNSELYVCTGDDIVLTATSEAAAQVLDLPDGTQVPAATFTWLKDGIEITDNTVIATVVENGIATSTLSETSTEADENVIYTVQINYHNDSGGCSLSKDIEVEVGFLFPHINDEFESVSFCEDDPNFNIELISHEIDQSSIEWYFTPFPVENNTPQSLNNDGNLQLTVDPSIYAATGGGEFSVVAYCNYTNDNVTGTIEVDVNSSTPSVSFPYTSSVDFCLNTQTTIDITGSDDYEYVWSYDGPEGDLDITNESTGEVIFYLPGTYDFSVFVSNGTCDPLEFIHTVTVMDFTPASEINDNLVNGDVVINTNMKIGGTVIVPSGRLLTIQYCQIGFANSLSGIEVMPGGILLIEGAELTESACNTDGFWKGIQVKSNHPGLYLFGSGDPYGQYASYGPGSIPPFSDLDNRGMVISRAAVVVDCCYHNTVIRNARIGILDDNTNDSAFKGKGILRIERTDFINNKIGISWGRAPIGNTNSIVENCNFINHYGSNEIYSSESDGLPIIIDGEAFLDNTIMIQIKILETFVSNIRNNNFRYEAANLGDDDEKYDEKVIGISSSDSQLVVGEFDTDGDGSTSQNNFENLYRAIDVYRLSNTIITDIVNNHFENNLTGITLTNIPMAHIASNEIIVPAGSNDAKTYGLFAQACTDYEIIENNLDFNGSANPDTYGMIINNSNSGGDNKNSYVNNNRFTGPFEIGTQLENNNTGLQIRCNGYYDNVKVDLAVTEVLGNGDVLDQQGEYNPTTSSPEKNLFSTFWHTNPTTDELHIFNETDNNLEFIEDANSLTNEIDGTDIVSFTGQPNGVPANLENPCYNSLEPGIPGVPGGGVIGNAGPPDQKCKIGYDCPIDINDCSTISGLTIRELSGIVKDLVRDKHKLVTQEGSSITMSIGRVLDCHNSVWAGKFKVGNYVSVGDYTNGRAALEELPQETEIDQAFYTLYDAYITIKETEEGSGKYYGPLQTIKDIASTENNNGPGQSLAQAMLANLLEYTYIRKPMPLKRDKSESTISEQACFYIVPNPVSGEFSLDFISQESKEQNWKVWELYNLQGQLIKLGNYNEENSLNVNRINNGVYFLKLIDATGLSCSNRLIIQH